MIRRWGIFDIYGWLSVCDLYNFIYRFHERRLRFCCWVGGTSSIKELAAPGQDRTLTCFKISFNMLLQCQTPPASSDVSLTPTPSRELLHLRTDADVSLSLESTLLKSGGKLWTLSGLSQVICRLPAGRTICLDIPQSKDSLTLPSLQRGQVLTQARAGAVRTKWPHVSVSISPSQQELRTGRTDPVEPWILDWASQWRELPAEPCEPRPGWRCRWRRGRPARRTGTARSRGCNGQALARCQVGRSGWSRSPLEHILSCSGARCQQDGGWGSAFPWTPSWHYREHWQCEWSGSSAVLQGWSSPWRCRWKDQEEPHPFPSRPHYTTQSWVPREKALPPFKDTGYVYSNFYFNGSILLLLLTSSFFILICPKHFCTSLLQKRLQLTDSSSAFFSDLLSHHSQTLVKAANQCQIKDTFVSRPDAV